VRKTTVANVTRPGFSLAFETSAPIAALAFCAFLATVGMAGCGGGGSAATPTPTPTPSAQTLRAAAAKHNLLMGAAADSGNLTESLYASTLSSEYSQLEPENEMKFGLIHPGPTTYAYSGPDALVAFAMANSMSVRGHNLVWDSQLPTWVTAPAAPWTPATLSQALSDHIASVVGHYQGKVYAWDVVNEPFDGNGNVRSLIWYDTPGIGFAGQGTKYIEQALNWAHAADPAAKLFVNDWGVETENAKSDGMYAMAQDFVARKVPLSGVGLEFHIDPSFDTAANLASFGQNIQRFGALGLEVHITELDVSLPDNSASSLAAEAKTYQDLLTVCLAQPACTAFQTWGFTDKYSWIPSFEPGYGWALPFDLNYAKKPAYTALLQELQ
jgi:endo-1,4-beta-xylanase